MKGRLKEKQKSAIKNIKILYEWREKVVKLFNDYSRIVFEVKQMLQRLPIALAQIKAGDISKNLLNKIRQIMYSLYSEKEVNKKYAII